MMANPHRIEITIRDGGYIDGRMLCDAPEGSDCRLWCDQGCDTHYGDCEGELSDQGYCVHSEGWFDGDPLDLYVGDEAPLRSGPVELIWEGEYYTWTYAKEKP